MNLSPAYLKWREDVKEEGRREGLQEARQEGYKKVIANLLKAKFGELDQELLDAVETLLKLSPSESSQVLLQLSNLSRSEFLELIKSLISRRSGSTLAKSELYNWSQTAVGKKRLISQVGLEIQAKFEEYKAKLNSNSEGQEKSQTGKFSNLVHSRTVAFN